MGKLWQIPETKNSVMCGAKWWAGKIGIEPVSRPWEPEQ